MAKLSKPRETALKILVDIDKNGAYLNLALREALENSAMENRDKALASMLVFGVTKNRLYIDKVIEKLSTVKLKKLSVWIHNILRIGVFSIEFLDKIPISATVNECVLLAKRYGHGASSGFVNAVLLNTEKHQDVCGDKNTDEYLSVKYSFPMWIVKLWRSMGYGEELFECMNQNPPVIVRMNTLKTDFLSEKFKRIENLPHAYIYIGGGTVEETEEYKNGLVSVQDSASQRAINLLSPKKHSAVLDLCSAPGGKTCYMAQLMENTGKIVACDIYEHKLALIENNCKRQGITNVKVMQNDALVLNEEFVEAFDYVVADVPCSGLGIIRRKPDIKWTKSENEISQLCDIQKRILQNASKYVKKGGKLLYSTCTVNSAENTETVKQFLSENKEFRIVDSCGPFGVQMLPNSDACDGFFAAVSERMS